MPEADKPHDKGPKDRGRIEDIVFTFTDKTYRREFPETGGKRIELYLGVRCDPNVRGLKVEVVGRDPEIMGGKVWPPVQLREVKGGGRGHGERLFHLAQGFEPTGIERPAFLRLWVEGVPENYPPALTITASAENAEPLVREGMLHQMGTWIKLSTLQIFD